LTDFIIEDKGFSGLLTFDSTLVHLFLNAGFSNGEI